MVCILAALSASLLSVSEVHTQFGQHRCNVDFILEAEVGVKGSTCLVNPQHSSCQCSLSLVQGKRVCVLTEEMCGLFTCLFQEGEQGVSLEQRVVGQMARICEQQAVCELRVDGMFCHLCGTIADVFLT